MIAGAWAGMIETMDTRVGGRTRFAVRTGRRQVAIVEAWSPSEALVEYLRGRGFQDSEIVRVGYDALAWRGQIFTAAAAASDALVGSRARVHAAAAGPRRADA